MTRLQRDLMAFIKGSVDRNGAFPSLDALSAHMGFRDEECRNARIRLMLLDLVGDGHIKIAKRVKWGRSRAYEYKLGKRK